jgi:hypothetical protein
MFTKIKEFIEDAFKNYNSPLVQIKDFILYDTPAGIKNLIRWFPIIWKDRNWDSYYIFIILKKKLERTEYCLRNGHCVDGDKRADQIKTCIALLDRLIEDQYHENAFIDHVKKWGELDMTFGEIESNGCGRLHITRPNIKTPEDEELEQKQSKLLYEHADRMRKQDVDYLCSIISKHVLGWWD